MKIIDINNLVRDNIKEMKPYSSARDEYSGSNAVFLDANENPNNAPFNRYPDPLQRMLKQKIAGIKAVSPESIFLGNGSDEAIDLIIRVFCRPGIDNILSIDPTYGMYKVCAEINGIEYRSVLLKKDYQIDVDTMRNKINANTKLIFLCSPNNPTSNSLNESDILEILDEFNGIVVLDEAYIDFSSQQSLVNRLKEYQNLVILQTFSKAWGLASIRLGMCFGDTRIISLMSKIKYPYNVNGLTINVALEAFENKSERKSWIKEILDERIRLEQELPKFPFVLNILPSDANFLMVKVKSPKEVYTCLINKGIVVRDRSNVNLCEGCLRFTIGTKEENDILLNALNEYKKR